MLLFGGAVAFNTPLPAVNDKPTSRWSISNECVGEPARTNTAEDMLAAFGVAIWKLLPYPITPGVILVIVGRVARLPSELKR